MTATEKRPRGRPRGPSPDSRSVTPCVRWRPEEWAKVVAAAAERGLSASEYVRRTVLWQTDPRSDGT